MDEHMKEGCPQGSSPPVVRYVPPGVMSEVAKRREQVIRGCQIINGINVFGSPGPESTAYLQ